ncbi:peroxiredoxin [Arthrobacter sp. 35W]|uniref:peroxiredoxin n=1 Tax=Arthrobacter sp. 35W TaxID=1132441 RepID=UPI00040B05BC|nr:peroxiredoxin [Arthrobacter sp. 35W]
MDIGDQVKDFELPDQHGVRRSLVAALASGPVVLFFYPVAGTPGCTQQACRFRDLGAEFAAAGATILGISADTVDRQLAFAQANRLGYPLLSDLDGAVADAFGVRRRLLAKKLPPRRATFVIGTDGIVREIIANELDMAAHADGALAALRTM